MSTCAPGIAKAHRAPCLLQGQLHVLFDSSLTPFICKTPLIYDIFPCPNPNTALTTNCLTGLGHLRADLGTQGTYWNVWRAACIFSRKKVNVLFLLLNSQFGSCKGPIKLVLTNYLVVKAVTSSRSSSFIAARFYTKTVFLVQEDAFSHHRESKSLYVSNPHVAFFASGKSELNRKCLSRDSPSAQPRTAASWQSHFPQKNLFLHEHRAHHDNISAGDIVRSCNGQKDSDKPQFSALVHEVYSPHGTGSILWSDSVVGVLQQCTIIPLNSTYQKQRKRPILASLNLWYITRWLYLLYYQWPHTTALQALGYPLKEDGERFLLLECGSVCIFQHDDCGCQTW